MYNKESLVKMFAEENIEAYEAAILPGNQSMIGLRNCTLRKFLSYVKSNGMRDVFFSFAYYDEDDFLIRNEYMSAMSSQVVEIIEREVGAYNYKVMQMDFTKPKAMNLFCLIQGHLILYQEKDLWAEREGLSEGQIKLQEIHDHSHELKNVLKQLEIERNAIEAEKRKQENALMEELKQYILADPVFHEKKFPGFRKDYIRNIFAQRPETAKYRHLLFDDHDTEYRNYRKSWDFIERLWREKDKQAL